jgi:hypothetical protein
MCPHSIEQLYITECDVCREDEVWCECGAILDILSPYETLGLWYYDPENVASPLYI